jgi:ubiquinone/menaquinone biosynthesis C-methylase UbiE
MQTSEGLKLGDDSAVRSSVSKYYGETLQATTDLKTSACCTAKAPTAEVRKILKELPEDITSRYYGCGSPFPVGLQGSGLRVLDLGCGTGRDCYVCAALVGEKGFVTGIDMTDAQLAFANKHSAAWQQHLGYAQPNMRYVKGAIEHLEASGIAAGSVDVIISNCVINLSPDKPAVLREAYRALADGGEVYFSDVYCDRRLPADARTHEVLLGECLGGALAINDFVRLCQQVGFTDPRVLEASPIDVHDPQLRELLGDAAFYSVTFRLFKLPGQLEAPPQEDYGQTVTYNGSIPGATDTYHLDSQHTFAAGVPVHVSGNTAAMMTGSWLKPHFTVTGSKAQHLGQFKPSSSSGLVDGVSVAALATKTGPAGACCPTKEPAQQQQQQQGGPCCPPAPKSATGCCPTPPAAAGTAGGGGGCCAPKQQQSGGCCPTPAAPAAASGNCAPKSNDCCPPKQQPATSCCPPKEQPKPAGGSNGSSGGCCPPKPVSCCPAPAAAAVSAPAVNGSSGGCCPPAKPAAGCGSSGGGCC